MSLPRPEPPSAQLPVVAAVAMGYGHLRAAHAIASALGLETVHVDRRRKNGSWSKNVGTATVHPDGKWHASFNAVSGTYRARLTPPTSTGLVPGVSPLYNFN